VAIPNKSGGNRPFSDRNCCKKFRIFCDAYVAIFRLNRSKVIQPNKLSASNRASNCRRAPMVTILLLHPSTATPVRSWTFDGSRDTIRVGRSLSNDVTLSSAVVSRRHFELRRCGERWKLCNLSANGTFAGQRRVDSALVPDGAVVRLANSGPRLQIHTSATSVGPVGPTAPAEPRLAPFAGGVSDAETLESREREVEAVRSSQARHRARR